MVLYLAALLAWGSFYFDRPDYLWKGILIAALYAAFDVLWTYLRDRVWYFPESSLISGLILALVGAPAPDFLLLILMPLLAVISKQLLRFGTGRHIFNPAAFSLVVGPILSVFSPRLIGLGPTWWGVSWGAPVMYAVLAAGIFILWRQRRWETALPFLAAYALLFNFQVFNGTVIFFASVMLIEPITSSFPGVRQRMAYGALVFLLTFLVGRSGLNSDPLLLGLLGGNIIFSLIKFAK